MKRALASLETWRGGWLWLTFVLNSMSQAMCVFSFFAVHVSPSSSTILPKRMPRAYMLGIEITYSVQDEIYEHHVDID